METIYDKDFNSIGNIEKSEAGGWFAYAGNWEDGEQQESYWSTKRQAIAEIKRKYKQKTKTKKQ